MRFYLFLVISFIVVSVNAQSKLKDTTKILDDAKNEIDKLSPNDEGDELLSPILQWGNVKERLVKVREIVCDMNIEMSAKDVSMGLDVISSVLEKAIATTVCSDTSGYSYSCYLKMRAIDTIQALRFCLLQKMGSD